MRGGTEGDGEEERDKRGSLVGFVETCDAITIEKGGVQEVEEREKRKLCIDTICNHDTCKLYLIIC